MRKNTTCVKCNNPLEPQRVGKHSYCLSCHASNMRKVRPKHKDLKPLAEFKANARGYANAYLNKGVFKKCECSKCGNPKAEKHHHDYSKPLEITWLCRKCHLDHHKQLDNVFHMKQHFEHLNLRINQLNHINIPYHA